MRVRRLAVSLGITLLIAAAPGPAGNALAAGRTIVVDQSGGGDLTTITEAVAAAEAGDVVRIRPGTYAEAVLIEKDITLKGDGPATDIVIVAPEQVATPVSGHHGDEQPSYAIFLKDSNATVSGLTLRGEPSIIIVRGGAPTLAHLRFEGVGVTETSPDEGSLGSSILVDEGSGAIIWGNDLVGGGPIAVYDRSTPLIEGNRLTGGPRIYGEFGDAAVVRGNTITDTPRRPAIILWEGAKALVELNTITDAGREGIGVRTGTPTIRENTIIRTQGNGIEVRQSDAAPWIVGNTVEDAGQNGINLAAGAARVESNTINGAGGEGISVTGSSLIEGLPAVVGNLLGDNAVGISWTAPAGTIEDNEVSGGVEGILVGLGSPTVTGNRIDGVERRGLFVGRGASPTFDGNASCGNGEDVVIESGAQVAGQDTTQTC